MGLNFILLQPQSGREPDHVYNEFQKKIFTRMKKLQERGLGRDLIIQYISDPLMKRIHPEDTDAVSMTSVQTLPLTAYS